MKAKLLPSLVCTSVIAAVVVGRRVHQSVKLEVPAAEDRAGSVTHAGARKDG